MVRRAGPDLPMGGDVMTTYLPSSQAGLATHMVTLSRHPDPLDGRSYDEPLPTLPRPARIVIPRIDREVTPVVYGGAR